MKKLLVSVSLSAFLFSATPFQLKAEPSDTPSAKAIRVTPPAPKFTDAERHAELGRRRAEVFKAMKPNSVFVLRSAEPRNYAGDVDFYYRQENNLYYLTNLKQNNATLVMVKGSEGDREYLFLPKRNPQFETWNGKMYSNEDAQRISGVKTIVDASETQNFLQAFKDKKTFTAKDGTSIPLTAETAYFLLPYTEGDSNGFAEFQRESDFSKSLAGYKVENARQIIDDLRHIKSPYELKLMQHAIDITSEAQMRSMGMVGKAKHEYEVQAEVEYTFRRRNADYWGYPSIVGCGPNATTLHYVESQGEVKAGDLMLMDVGAEYDHYTADVTRTYPVNGKFSKEQAEIYQIVYDAQEAAAKATKPGATMKTISEAADAVIKDGLFKLGLITDKNSNQHRIWYMHGLGHWLGMNVHDVGRYGRPFQAGMIFTNEPGIYIREDALEYLPKTPEMQAFVAKVRPVFEKYKNIGVRIEDDMLVTETGVEWMTKNLPRKLSDVEAFMARATKEMAYTDSRFNSNPMLAVLNLDANTFLNNDLIFNQTLSGKTIRRGWIHSGKNAAHSGLSHLEHSHGE
ncbi:MAG TPA: aminopeptidase P family protein [Pyrinomonadaceae bacterium]|jgi:Xaa-Pro aminopeptidase